MHAAILTFPGHFFQTLLSVDSLVRFYPEINEVTFILDDIDKTAWLDYASEFEKTVKNKVVSKYQIRLTSEIDQFDRCVSGWWRQQLVKMFLDRILDGDQWFVVDGDTIFETRCEIENIVPITRRHDIESNFSKMSLNYVRTLLGSDDGCLSDGKTPVCTNAVPFRLLNRSLLQSLRSHVENKFKKDFLQLHLDWFDDQTIVADINPPDRIVMSEWELIECYRRYILGISWPFVEIGSGYGIDVDLSGLAQDKNLFRHAYQWDTEIGKEWFREKGLEIDDDVWQHQIEWYQTQQRYQ